MEPVLIFGRIAVITYVMVSDRLLALNLRPLDLQQGP